MRTAYRAMCLVLALLCLAAGARAQNVKGLFVNVPNRINSDFVNSVKTSIAKMQEDLAAAGPGAELKIVFDFNPDNQPAASDDFGACSELMRFFLNKLQTTKTIAFVHAPVSKHTVLPVLACKEIVMSREGRLGPALGENEPLEDIVRAGYKQAADGRGLSPALVMKLVQRDLDVFEGTRNGAKVFVSREEADQLRQKPGFQLNKPDPILPQGLASYTAEQASAFGLCAQILPTREEVAQAYHMPLSSLKGDPLAGRAPVAALVRVEGALTAGAGESLGRRIDKALGQKKANTIILWLACGGRPEDNTDEASRLAEVFRTLKDDKGQDVLTIAYIPGEAPDTATILAMACDEIVMHKAGVLGDFSRVDGNELVRNGVMKIAREQGFPELLARGMFERPLTIYEATRKAGAVSEYRLMTQQELDAERDKWNAKPIKQGANNELLTLPAQRAKDLRLVRAVIDTPDPSQGLAKVYELYSVKDVPEVAYDWLDDVSWFLRLPLVMFFLVTIAAACALWEFLYPGKFVPGIIAALLFVLFFWSWYDSAGLTLLSVLLFMLGLVLIAVEIFVIPGFGITGFSGVILVVTGLALATGLKWPQTQAESMSLAWTFATFGGSIIASGACVIAGAIALPHIPYLNKLILKPPSEAPDGGAALSDLLKPETAALLGAVGVADTMLRPAGRAKFGEELIDVVSDGGYVEPGTSVQVVQIEGNRIVVKPV